MREQIEIFLRDLGFRDIRFGKRLPVLKIANGSSIQFEDLGDRIAMSLRRTLEVWQFETYLSKMLRAAHFGERCRFQIQPGMINDQQCVLTIQLDAEESDLRTMYDAFDLLRQFNRRLLA